MLLLTPADLAIVMQVADAGVCAGMRTAKQHIAKGADVVVAVNIEAD